MPQKCILVLLDGLGDRSYRVLGNRTPLQAAKTPVLDGLAARGATGMYHAAMLGQALPSENAHFSMFGYDLKDFPGRGALEALGSGIDISNGEVAILSHFVSVSEKEGSLVLEDGKPEADVRDIEILAKTISEFRKDEITVTWHPGGGIRGTLVLGGDVAPFITDSDPFVNGRPLVCVQPWKDAQAQAASKRCAAVISEYLKWAYRQLRDHPVNAKRTSMGKLPLNALVTQRAGQLKKVVPFENQYGLRGLSMASGMVYWGLAAYIGMGIEKVSDSKDPGADLAHRIKLAHQLLADYDFIHVHTKTPDEAAHTKDPLFKKKVIAALDAGIGQAIEPVLNDPDVLVIITADHSTPSSGPLIHSGESVPLAIVGEGVRQDDVSRFDEVSTAKGALGMVRGKELMYLVLNHLERAKLVRIMDTPIDQPYWPGPYVPFKLGSCHHEE